MLCKKNHLKIADFEVHESGSPDFGKPWAPNGWQQVNFRSTPENFGVWRFKLAMWEVGGIKIERNIFLCLRTEIAENVFFW